MMRWVAGGVTAAQGFVASGISAGIKRARKPDVALVMATRRAATAAAVFTTNRIQAAPVLISKRRIRKKTARAVLLNSGCANCLTGSKGLQDALRISQAVATGLGVREGDILLASTGIIARRLPVLRVLRVVPRLIQQLSSFHHRQAAEAILTTDLQPKEVAVETTLQGQSFRVGAMAKGSGMIAPSMATMLCVITTDVAISPVLLHRLLREATMRTFNRISVDSDMSTNDTVFILASGDCGVEIKEGTKAQRVFATLLHAVCQELSRRIVEDGEGATRLMEVHVMGARTLREAHACARQVATSPLVKTMLAGSDPNVGRIAAAVGASPARFKADRLEIYLGNRCMISKGVALTISKSETRHLLEGAHVKIRIDLNSGFAEDRFLSCDLTQEYVRINSGYAT